MGTRFISLTAAALTVSMAVPAHAKMSKKFLSGMDSIASTLHLTDEQTSCIAAPIYDDLGKKDAKEFVKVVNGMISSGMVKADEIPSDVSASGQVFLLDKIMGAYVGTMLMSKGFSIENLKYAKNMSSAKVKIADGCQTVFPGADMNVFRSSPPKEPAQEGAGEEN